MAVDDPPPSGPGPEQPSPSTDRGGGRERPSIRVRTAATLLRHGHRPLEVAESTGVPLALVEFLDDHRPATDDQDHDGNAVHCHHTQEAGAGDEVADHDVFDDEAAGRELRARVQRLRWQARLAAAVAVAVAVLFAVNAAVALTAAATGLHALALASLITPMVLLTVLQTSVIASSRHRRHGRNRPGPDRP